MHEAQFRETVIRMIEEYAAGWKLNGPARATADAIVKKIRAMPLEETDAPVLS